MTRKNLPRILRLAREKKGLSQTDLAKRLRCHVSTVSGWESESDRHRASSHFERIARLMHELDLDPAELAS